MIELTRHRAFTLLELLAVVALLGLVTALTVGVIKPLASGQSRVLAEATVRESVLRARLVASRQGGCALELGAAPRIVGTRVPASDPGGGVRLPNGWTVSIGDQPTPEYADDAAGGVVKAIAFGPDGVCDDAVISLRGPRGERVSLRLSGLTGRVDRVDESEVFEP